MYLLPHNALVTVALFPAASSLFIIPEKGRKIFFAIHILFAALIILSFLSPVPPAMSEYKSLSRIKLIDDVKISVEKSGSHSLVHIAESDRIRHAPGLSLNYTGQLPVHRHKPFNR